MAITITPLKRIFKFSPRSNKKLGGDKEPVTLADPNPMYTPEEVLDHYSMEYPELSNSIVVPGEVNGDCYIYNIETTMETKG